MKTLIYNKNDLISYIEYKLKRSSNIRFLEDLAYLNTIIKFLYRFGNDQYSIDDYIFWTHFIYTNN